MYVQQSQSILFFPRKSKTNKKDDKVPLYARLTIDGRKKERAVPGVRIHPDHWDTDNKRVKDDEPKAKAFNKKISQMETDLGRHVDLEQAKEGIATPEAVLKAYEMPVRAVKLKEEKIINRAFSEKLDELIYDYVKFNKRYFKAYEFKTSLPEAQAALLDEKKMILENRVDQIVKEGNVIFDDKDWKKTIILAVDAHLVNFISMVKSGHRVYTTLEKMWGRKKRFIEFLEERYKVIDLPLAELQFKFINELKAYCMNNCAMLENSVSKYTQEFKEVITRAVSSGWLPANIFENFVSVYTQPTREWLTWEQMYALIDFKLSKPQYNLVRDLYVFEAFTGYAYAELRSAKPQDTREGIDGKLWISKARKKTKGDETLPFLPIALDLMDRYKDHPVCLKRGTLFPVPSNEYYNRCLKEIAKEIDFITLLFSHSARYFFANEVLYNNGVQLKTIARIMGQKSVKSAEIYVRANRTAISESMQAVQEKLCNPDGTLKSSNKRVPSTAKIIKLRAV